MNALKGGHTYIPMLWTKAISRNQLGACWLKDGAYLV